MAVEPGVVELLVQVRGQPTGADTDVEDFGAREQPERFDSGEDDWRRR